MVILVSDCLLPWQQSAIYSYERKWNPGCVRNLHCECQEVKPKVETNTSFLVRHPFSGVDSVKTVGSHLKQTYWANVFQYILFATQFRSWHDSFWRLQLFCLYILSCTQLRVNALAGYVYPGLVLTGLQTTPSLLQQVNLTCARDSLGYS